jgi:hypothetical protein
MRSTSDEPAVPATDLAYREDWPEAADRLARWWEGEYVGRPAMQVTAPRDGATWQELPQPPDWWEYWTNPAYVVPRTEQSVRNTAWLAESCPFSWVNLGPVSSAGYLGTGIHIKDDRTVWQSPIVDDWQAYDVRFDPANEWWQITRRMTEALAEAAEGKWHVGNADLGDPGDVMSYLRGPRRLCLDLIDGPHDGLLRARDRLTDQLWWFYDELTVLVADKMAGTASWMGVWSPKRMSTLQCDFSCMISAGMFERFFIPPLAELSRRLDHVIYHLDGPGALQHLDLLLALPNLHAIQWVPGSGAESQAHPRWRPLLKRIIGAGKRVHLSVAPGEIEDLVADLPPEGLFLQTGCASEAEARELIRQVERWSDRASRGGPLGGGRASAERPIDRAPQGA